MERLIYFIRRALRNMRQCPFLCSVAIGTAAVALTIIAFFAIVVLNVQLLTEHWSRQVEIVAYLDAVPDAKSLQGLQAKILALPEVESVDYVTREEAFSQFRKRLGNDADLLNGVDADILPASMEIALKPPFRNQAGVDGVVSRLQKEVGLKDLKFGREWLEKFESFVALLKLGGAVIGGFLLFAALFIVSNTIRLTQYARRDELEVMGLVGATSMFIKTPFLIEGAIQGALGGIIAIVGSFALFRLFLHEGLSSLLLASGSGAIVFLPLSFQGLLLAAGVFLGLFGSLMSLRKLVRI
ncbi:permease-like cell division protein FtsX [Trichloromonas sp.]|uniref:permease-like cell division protein FtsX n=1 Tax=Trichloromonas sp. TaxID=3069249 RepID=UPI003D81310C